MTLKYNDLLEFVAHLRRQGFKTIGTTTLRREIGKQFGISPYVQTNILKALREFGIMELDSNKIHWHITVTEADDMRKIDKMLEDVTNAPSTDVKKV